MRPFDEDSDYSDVALLMAGVREWPSEEFARDLDGLVERRFAAQTPPVRRVARRRLPRWAAGPAVAVVAGAIAAGVVLSGGGPGPAVNGLVRHAAHNGAETGPLANSATTTGGTVNTTATSSPSGNAPSLAAGSASGAPNAPLTTAAAPVAPGRKQIRSAQIALSTANQHVDEVASEVFGVVGTEHGSVLSSHVTTATSSSGGGYASFSLSIPTSNLQDAMTQLSRLRYAALTSSSAGSQNVSNQYNNDQRQLADAKALRTSLLKQLQTAYTQTSIDSIKAQLKLAEQQINTWQSALGSLEHRISYSNLSVQVNAGGLPVTPVTKHSSAFTIGRAGHDALRVLVVSAGVVLIALAVALPVGLVAALLVWLWVWLRQRRREHALDAVS